jgi:hypothetical protein
MDECGIRKYAFAKKNMNSEHFTRKLTSLESNSRQELINMCRNEDGSLISN